MREDNLLCLRHSAVRGDHRSRHGLPVYPNLAREMRPEAINQLWVADITYIRQRAEVVYLAVVLDAFSRRVIGWALGRTLEAKLAIAALRMAIDRAEARGRYGYTIPIAACSMLASEYTDLLKQHLKPR